MPLFRKKNVANVSTRAALPPGMANLLRESWWLILVVVLAYLVLVLSTYNQADPGWSHSATEAQLYNRGGSFGAWVADVLLYTFGFSAWWWTVFLFAAILWGYRRIDRVAESPRPVVFLACLGFTLILLSSSTFEALRMHSLSAPLPYVPGGMLGLALGTWMTFSFGFSGATLLLIAAFCLGVSLFTGLSWLNVMENIGTTLEAAYLNTINAIQAAKDRRIGRETKKIREEQVVAAKQKQAGKDPLIIETPNFDVTSARQAEKRIEREKKEQENAAKQAAQALLFAVEDLPVAPTKRASPTLNMDNSLPGLALLAPAVTSQETISKETLEFTSRLIERKLADFNVEVKIVAAYPGPVITRYEIEPAVGVKGSQIVNLMKDLARALGLVSIRVVETIPGKTYMGLELPNPTRQMIRLSEILSSEAWYASSSRLTMALGKDITGKPIVTDLGKAPHM
ncbi:MAG: DNA translocase FtsK 4TM domain-containing protein, partial [Deefgea sp.]